MSFFFIICITLDNYDAEKAAISGPVEKRNL